jgi:hypothetical protein
MNSLYSDPLIQHFNNAIVQRMNDLIDIIAKGALTHEQYKRTCGEVIGLKSALELLNESIETYTNDDDS